MKFSMLLSEKGTAARWKQCAAATAPTADGISCLPGGKIHWLSGGFAGYQSKRLFDTGDPQGDFARDRPLCGTAGQAVARYRLSHSGGFPERISDTKGV